MEISAKGAEFIRIHEGFVPRWYLDPVGVPTIGIGFTWGSAAFREWWGRKKPGVKFARGATITRPEAEDALRYICDKQYGAAVDRFLARAVAQHVFDGAVSPVFNLGPGALEWKWAAALKEGNIAEAARLLKGTGTTAKGRRLAGLVTRRKEEAELIHFGDYAVSGVLPVEPVADPMADGMLVRGERGEAVKDLQHNLAAAGYYDGKIDGIFGFGTEAAVLAFQRAEGIKADGWAGPKTLAALKQSPLPAGDTGLPDASMEVPPRDETRGHLGFLFWGGAALLVVIILIFVFNP